MAASSLTERRKNLKVALDALAMLVVSGKMAAGVVVDIVGPAPDDFRQWLVSAQIPHVLHGSIKDHTALSRILAQSDILLVPSLEDNWPNVLVEAGSYGGVPVVGPGHGCEEFVLTYGFGHVARNYSSAAFAQALNDALSNLDLKQRRRAALAIRAEHAPTSIAANLKGILAKLDRSCANDAEVWGAR